MILNIDFSNFEFKKLRFLYRIVDIKIFRLVDSRINDIYKS